MAMQTSDKILVLGGRGLVGSSLVRELTKQGYTNILSPFREELDLEDQAATKKYFDDHSPDVVFNAAAKVGGILANNTFRADFIFKNLKVQDNVFGAADISGVRQLIFLGSSCIYPKMSPQPIKEEYLLTGPLEETNEPYAIAKIAGLKTAESFRRQYGKDFVSAMPTNLYGVNDNFDESSSHVIPGLINRMQKAIDHGDKIFKVWGTGKPRREFLYVDDMARACIYIAKLGKRAPDWMNVGCGEDIAIGDLAQKIASLMGFSGAIEFDASKPDGTPRKLLDVSKLFQLGWRPEIGLDEGLRRTIEYYREKLAGTPAGS